MWLIVLFLLKVTSFVTASSGTECNDSGDDCANGYMCRLYTGKTSGYCVPIARLGEMCNARGVQYPAKCEAGLACKFPETNLLMTGGSGTCVLQANVGEECGESPQFSSACGENAICIGPNISDGKSYCNPVSNTGGPCGGSGSFAPVCKPNAKCLGSGIPGEPGECYPVSGKGGECGGGIPYAHICEDGLHCVIDIPLPGRKGTCL